MVDVQCTDLCWLIVIRASHKKMIAALESELRKLQSLLNSEKQLRSVELCVDFMLYAFLIKDACLLF